MDVICRGRRCGKTVEAIKLAAKAQHTIVCHSAYEVKRVQEVAERLGYKIPQPITFDDFKNGSEIKTVASGYVIDNADMLLQSMAGSRPIRAITFTHEMGKSPYIVDDAERMPRLSDWDPKQMRAMIHGEWRNDTGDIEPQLVEPIPKLGEGKEFLTIPTKRMTKKEIKKIYGSK